MFEGVAWMVSFNTSFFFVTTSNWPGKEMIVEVASHYFWYKPLAMQLNSSQVKHKLCTREYTDKRFL